MRGHIRTSRALLFLFVVALAISSYVHFAIYGMTLNSHSWGRGLGEMTGASLMLTVFPALVIIPWRIFQNWRGRITDIPILVGGILFVLLAVYFVNGAKF